MNKTRRNLISKYLNACSERDARNAGTLNVEETAGYWLFETSNPLEDFIDMLKINDISLKENEFYCEVFDLLLNSK